ncbi:MAG: FAD-binding oxidoreductase [Polyangiales bacterium]
MRRWNGWGDEANHMELKPEARAFLEGTLGKATPLRDAKLADVIAKVPPSRLPEHPLVSTDAEVRVRHARGQSFPDWLAMRSGEFGFFPDGVASPTTSDEVRSLLEWAKEEDVVVIPYGGGTSVAGHINPEASEKPVLTLSLARMNRLLHLDRQSQIATFGAGTQGPALEEQLAQHGYTLGHFPQSFELSTVGGWVASRSSGQQSLRYGRIEQMFAGGTVETPRGRLELPTFPASSAGPDLRETILGSEGRMGVLTEVKVRVTRRFEKETFQVVFMPSWQAGMDCVREAAQRKLPLSMVRLSNAIETRTQLIIAGHKTAIRLLETYLSIRGAEEGKVMLTFGATGSRSQVDYAVREMLALCTRYDGVPTGTVLGKKWEENRFRSPYLRHGLWEEGYAVDTLETATDWPNVPGMVDQVEAAIRHALEDEGEKVHVFTHLSHVYPQGSSCYTTYIFRNAPTYEATYERWRRIKTAASKAIVANHGTISHQHGVGIDHAPYLVHEKGELGMETLRAMVRHFDPDQRMNPGKLLRP